MEPGHQCGAHIPLKVVLSTSRRFYVFIVIAGFLATFVVFPTIGLQRRSQEAAQSYRSAGEGKREVQQGSHGCHGGPAEANG